MSASAICHQTNPLLAKEKAIQITLTVEHQPTENRIFIGELIATGTANEEEIRLTTTGHSFILEVGTISEGTRRAYRVDIMQLVGEILKADFTTEVRPHDQRRER